MRWALRQLMFVGLLVLVASVPAYAVDGVIEINQARAKAGGVTSGDSPGFPVTISQPGSYRLTGNLDISQETGPENVTVIEITTDNVTIDLNGFNLLGTTTCTYPPTTCSPTGSGIGIDGKSHERLRVTNGRVTGMGDYGVKLGFFSQLENVIAMDNGGYGLLADIGSTVSKCIAEENGGTGIATGQNAVVIGNNGSRNGGNAGISTGNSTTVINNTAILNDQVGIRTENDSTVIGNTAFANTGVGLYISTGTGYANNVVNNNNGGNANPQVTGGVQMGTNVCGGDTTCP